MYINDRKLDRSQFGPFCCQNEGNFDSENVRSRKVPKYIRYSPCFYINITPIIILT